MVIFHFNHGGTNFLETVKFLPVPPPAPLYTQCLVYAAGVTRVNKIVPEELPSSRRHHHLG